MDPLFLLLAGAGIWLWLRTRRPRRRGGRNRRPTRALRTIRGARRPRHRSGQAGASGDARARHLRGRPINRLAAAVGIDTHELRLADRAEAGSVGERLTAALLADLTDDGWTIFHDLALPRRRTTGSHSRANIDHLLISPDGTVTVPDSKLWTSEQPLTIRHGRLLHGRQDVTSRLSSLAYETRTVSTTLDVPVTALAVIHGAPLHGPDGHPVHELSLPVSGIRVRIVPADRIVSVLQAIDATTVRTPAARALAERARREFPPYTSRN